MRFTGNILTVLTISTVGRFTGSWQFVFFSLVNYISNDPGDRFGSNPDVRTKQYGFCNAPHSRPSSNESGLPKSASSRYSLHSETYH